MPNVTWHQVKENPNDPFNIQGKGGLNREKLNELRKSKENESLSILEKSRKILESLGFGGKGKIEVLPRGEVDTIMLKLGAKEVLISWDKISTNNLYTPQNTLKNQYKIFTSGKGGIIETLSLEEAIRITGEILKFTEILENPRSFGFDSFSFKEDEYNNIVCVYEKNKILTEKMDFFPNIDYMERVWVYDTIIDFVGVKYRPKKNPPLKKPFPKDAYI